MSVEEPPCSSHANTAIPSSKPGCHEGLKTVQANMPVIKIVAYRKQA